MWAAQGAIMISYPEEKDKSKCMCFFWSISTLSLDHMFIASSSIVPTGEASQGIERDVALLLDWMDFGALTDHTRKAARFSGSCKAVQNAATSECLDSIFERNEEFEDVHIGTLADMINNSSGSSSWEGKEPRESDTTFSQSMT
ncbi:hypothetical protein AXG93_1712s1360 [Marchantia polymorpha subsp. ruderalis]|uniref:Uncharacterized protein n=1 Tax=Marchantia polymorpha subsp. ruderalis TaxID=1480154 RepID=A0A176VYY9_MARPO|nr:hypothetical protein AXG93_1712s1360 [Marchantia polymorpha subsp. ruderalis]